MGYARIAKNSIIPAIMKHEGSVLYAVASRSKRIAMQAQADFGFEKVFTSYQALLEDPLVDVVYIPLPNALHKEWAIRAMQAGKNVLCEKPMAMNRAEAGELVSTARRCNVFLMEAFMYRFSDRLAVLERLLAEKVIGDIRSIHSSYRFVLNRENTIKENPELGGGSLYDVGCYPVSIINLVMKAQPVDIKTLRNINANGVDVSIHAILRYADGRMAHVDAGFDSISSKCTEISGTLGAITVPETFVDSDLPITLTLAGNPKPTEYPVFAGNRYLAQIDAVYNAIVSGKKELLDLEWSTANAGLLDRIFRAG